MHQWLVTLNVQTVSGINGPIVVKVEVSDSLFARRDADQLRQLVDLAAQETVIDPRGNRKLWTTHTVPLAITVTDISAIRLPVAETKPPDHNTFSDIFTWVKKPDAPFS